MSFLQSKTFKSNLSPLITDCQIACSCNRLGDTAILKFLNQKPISCNWKFTHSAITYCIIYYKQGGGGVILKWAPHPQFKQPNNLSIYFKIAKYF